MATELVLYIQEDITNSNSFVEADLYRDEKVSLTMTIQNVKDVEKVIYPPNFFDYMYKNDKPISNSKNRYDTEHLQKVQAAVFKF